MEFKRNIYLDKLIRKQGNGLIKIVSGIRRCGKSYLLFTLFREYLLNSGVLKSHIIGIPLDDRRNKKYRDPDVILEFIESQIDDDLTYYVMLDEVQYLDEFEDVLNSLLHFKNLDVYVSGSNSRFLSSDVVTQFRGRGDEIRVHPLSFVEYKQAFPSLSVERAFNDYMNYGGLPQVALMENIEDKTNFLRTVFERVYLSDIIERNNVLHTSELDDLVRVLASSVGSYSSYSKLAKTFESVMGRSISDKTIKNYVDYLIDAFMISKSVRYDIKGRKYIGSPQKFYFEDAGIRNACLGFRQTEPTHLMENIVYNELCIRGFNVDVGVVYKDEISNEAKRVRKQLEVDFVATKGSEMYYIQSAYALKTEAKTEQEKRSLLSISDSFKKIIVVGDNIGIRRDDNGVVTIGIYDFLLNQDSLRM